MMRAASIAITTAAVALSLTGCGDHADPNSLFPLATGMRWHYRVTTGHYHHQGQQQSTRTLANVARTRYDGEAGVVIRRNNYGTRYYLSRRDDGIYRVAKKPILAKKPVRDQPALKVLALPAKAGTTWRETAHTYLLQNAKTFVSERRPGNAITLNYRIAKTDVDVEVPAGRYQHCVLAVGKKVFHLGVEVGVAASDVPVIQKEWYCPGTGLVRLARDEKLMRKQKTISGGYQTIELARVER